MKNHILTIFLAIILFFQLSKSEAQQANINNGVGVYQNGSPIPSMLVGTSASIGGSLLTLGQCLTTTVSIPGATNGSNGTIAMAVVVTPNGNPGTLAFFPAYISSPGIVTLNVCALIAGTPAAMTYNIRVLP